MAFTRHGHHISGTVLNDDERPDRVARCGGPKRCTTCKYDVDAYYSVSTPLDEDPVVQDKDFSGQSIAKQALINWYNDQIDKGNTTTKFRLTVNEVYVVWYSATLQNWKAVLSTTIPDGQYYEIAYDGDNQKLHFTAYKEITKEVFNLRPSPQN